MQKVIKVPPETQRALVFQGGGSLGAYEAGVYHVLYHWYKKKLSENENVFDIIAGTSIGAINASIIINNFLENKEKDTTTIEDEKSKNNLKYWEGSPEKLLNFWKQISSHSTYYDAVLSLIKNNWDFNKNIVTQMFPYLRYFIDLLVSGESLRRYYSTKKRVVNGEPYVFDPLFVPPFPTLWFNKFFDFSPNSAWWYQYSNLPLKKSILDFAPKLEYDYHYGKGSIKTNFDHNEPRLLLVAADIQTAKPETFDSFDKRGITINHVLASAAIPINYPYMEINGKKYWDGGILSNTPVRELISSHTDFWTKKFDSDNILDSFLESENKLSFDKWDEFYKLQQTPNIPDLSLTVVNLHPESEEGNHIPSSYDYDMTKDREKDIRFHDKTDYDIKLAQNISDYYDFVEQMTDLANNAIKEVNKNNNKDSNTKSTQIDNDSNKSLKTKFEDIINSQQRTRTRGGQPRYFYDLIDKRFDIIDVLKIERKDDEYTISDKIFDFSQDSISGLINKGIYDTLYKIHQKEEDKATFKEWFNIYREDIEKEDKDILKPVLEFQKKERP
ncbi:MAG: patatin-like phospholipase family protein [Nitrososphaeraceae archaeon]